MFIINVIFFKSSTNTVCQALACARNLAWSSGVHQSAVWASTQETQHKRETKEGKNERSGQLIAVHATRLLVNFYIMCLDCQQRSDTKGERDLYRISVEAKSIPEST